MDNQIMQVIMKKILVCILLVLMLLSVGSETRPLSPTMVSHYMLQGSTTNNIPLPSQPIHNGGFHEKKILSPGGPDAHHHFIKS